MAKRFTDTEKWVEDWFISLPTDYKLLWIYLCDKCDCAGIWKPNVILLNHLYRIKINVADALKFLNQDKERIVVLENGRWFLTGFISFQYGNQLKEDCAPHRGVLKILKDNNINSFNSNTLGKVPEPSERVKEGLDKGSDTLKDKDKDKDKDIPLLKKKEKKDGITPTLEQVTSFCSERGNIVDPHKFFNHYESNGWKVGRNPMKNWKAAVITWERSEFGNNGKKEEQNGNQYPHE
jgi:hypothetical protein